MKISVTGSRGLLGSTLCEVFAKAGHICTGIHHENIEARSVRSIASLLESSDLVVHAAANTDVERCEVDADACYRDNFLLTDAIARAASLVNAPVVYISSTGVYGSYQDEPYCEYSEVRPSTHHHRAKHLGEQVVVAQDRRNLVVRTGWLFGGRPDLCKNFVARRIDEARDALYRAASIASNADQRGVPTYTVDVAERLLMLIESGHAGIFNCVNEGAASRFDYVAAIVEAAGLSVDVVPVRGARFNRKANVSQNETAANWKMDNAGLPPMLPWRESLTRYIIASGFASA